MSCCTNRVGVLPLIVAAATGAGAYGLWSSAGESEVSAAPSQESLQDSVRSKVQEAQEAQEGVPSMEDMAQVWLELASTDTPEHKALAPMVGTFSATSSFIDPGTGEEMASTGKSVNEWVLGERFVRTHFSSPEMMGMPFEGIGHIGYDRISKEYIQSWMDNWFTGIMIETGQMEGNVLTIQGKMQGPMGEERMRHVLTIDDNDHHTLEFFMQMPDGQWMSSGSIKYTRTK